MTTGAGGRRRRMDTRLTTSLRSRGCSGRSRSTPRATRMAASCRGHRAGSLSEAATGARTETPPPPPPRPKKRLNPRRGDRGPGPACSAPGRPRPPPRDSARPSPPRPRRGLLAPTGRQTGRSPAAPTRRPSGPNRRTRQSLCANRRTPNRQTLRPDPRRPCSRTRCSTRPAVTLTRGARWAGRDSRPSRGPAPRPSPSRPASNGRNRWDPSEGLGPGSGSSWTTGRVESTRTQTRRHTRRRRRSARCCPAAAACCPSRGRRRRRRPGSSAPGRTTGGGSNRGQGYRDVPWTSALPTTSTRRGKWTVTTRE
mmetsp:Transcript_10619/g.44036  ORF Transcript_10619/g.44036 Transcript_10619/m.44036 type:complete len:311 (+) Transcript_10619:1513-2445(+)